jgi:hypothetical protein
VALRIAFDLDGVLADMDSELGRHAESLFGQAVTRHLENDTADLPQDGSQNQDAPPIPPTSSLDAPSLAKLRLTSRQQQRLWRHIAAIENFWEGLHELEPGVVARLGSVAADRRWEILFLTKRPATAGSTAQIQTQRWLESRGFPRPSVYVVTGSRGKIAAAFDLDIVVDDRPENCLDVVADSKARAILVWRGDEKELPAAARRISSGTVKSVAECIDILERLDAAGKDAPGVMSLVRRLLGLKEPAGT